VPLDVEAHRKIYNLFCFFWSIKKIKVSKGVDILMVDAIKEISKEYFLPIEISTPLITDDNSLLMDISIEYDPITDQDLDDLIESSANSIQS
jgi:hypothetical protein